MLYIRKGSSLSIVIYHNWHIEEPFERRSFRWVVWKISSHTLASGKREREPENERAQLARQPGKDRRVLPGRRLVPSQPQEEGAWIIEFKICDCHQYDIPSCSDAPGRQDDGGAGGRLAPAWQLQGEWQSCWQSSNCCTWRCWTCWVGLVRPPWQYLRLTQGGWQHVTDAPQLVLDPHLAVACRARVSLLEKCPERVAQCEQALARIVPPAKLEAAFQQEVICDLLSKRLVTFEGGYLQPKCT